MEESLIAETLEGAVDVLITFVDGKSECYKYVNTDGEVILVQYGSIKMLIPVTAIKLIEVRRVSRQKKD